MATDIIFFTICLLVELVLIAFAVVVTRHLWETSDCWGDFVGAGLGFWFVLGVLSYSIIPFIIKLGLYYFFGIQWMPA